MTNFFVLLLEDQRELQNCKENFLSGLSLQNDPLAYHFNHLLVLANQLSELVPLQLLQVVLTFCECNNLVKEISEQCAEKTRQIVSCLHAQSQQELRFDLLNKLERLLLLPDLVQLKNLSL